jgi:hypothetical protein
MPPSTLSRLDQRVAELGDTTPTTVLCVCGDVIRSRPGSPKSARPEETERALGALSLAEVASAVGAVDLVATKKAVERAASDAFEAAFADSPEERELFVASSMEGLLVRDRVASLLVAARARLDLAAGRGEASSALIEACASLEARLGSVERARATLARQLTGANAARRAALSTLTDDAAKAAWWYSDRSSDDGLLPALVGEVSADASESIRADLERSALPVRARDTLDSAALLAAAEGRLSGEARARLERRGAADADLRLGLELAVDETIEREAESA